MKITILIFVNVKKKQRPKALLSCCQIGETLSFADATNHMTETAVDIHNFCRNAR